MSSFHSSSTASSSSPPASPTRVLYRHVLELVFSYSDLAQLHALMCVCKGWTAAVTSMPPIASGELTEESQLQALMQSNSPLARHIISVPPIELDPSSPSSLQLSDLVRRLPNLRALEWGISSLALAAAPTPMVFPARLTQLNLSLVSASDSESPSHVHVDFAAVIEAVGRLTHLTDLTLQLPQDGSAPAAAEVRFTPLINLVVLHSLRTLEIGLRLGGAASRLTEGQIDDIRLMRSLHSLRVDGLNEALERLLAPDDALPPLQWRRIHPASTGWRLSDQSSRLLPLLPSLTELDVWIVGAPVDSFARLPLLSTLTLRCRLAAADSDTLGPLAESLLSELSCCAQLTNLSLSTCPFSSAHFAALLPRLPLLKRLEIWSSVALESLSFLAVHMHAQPPPAFIHSLTCFELKMCTRIPAADISMLNGLHALESLELDRSFDAPLDASVLRLYEPPSSLLPALESFEYQAPRMN